MKKVLVTGANGLLGSHVARELLLKKYAVRALVRRNSDTRALEGLGIEYFTGELTLPKDISNAVKGCDYVIHVAARTSQSPSSLKHYEKPNIGSTKSIVEACKKHGVKRMVYVSSANCFGNGTKENPGNENAPFMPWLKHSGYAYSKYLAQQVVLGETKNNGFNAVVVSPAFIIGERDFKPSSGKIFGHVLNKRIAFYPCGGKNFAGAQMAAQGVVNAMEKGKTGECYLLAGENLSYLEFFKMIRKATKQKTLFVPVPSLLLLFAGFWGSVLEKAFGTTTQLTLTNARMLCSQNYYTPQKAVSEIGLRTIPLYKSVEKAILWFQTNNYFK